MRTPIPITVDETLNLLNERKLLDGNFETKQAALDEVQPPHKDVLISAKNLQFTYPGGVEALKNISLDIHAGEWLMIVGRNGAGKSTLARLLVGLSKAKEGALKLFGKDSRAWKVQDLANHLALVFQNPEHQFLTDTVADEIGYSLLAQGVNEPEEKELRTLELLQQLGLEAYRETHPFSLSAGLKRRLGVATMLGGNPDVLLVDEPTYGQDKEMTHTLMALMHKIREQGVAVVMITHDMRLVQEYAERVVVMSGGRILFDGASAGLFEQEDVLTQANLRRTILHALINAMEKQGVHLQQKVRCTADLVEILKNGNIAEQIHG